jgi:ribonuclease BN (tRNA processing enzyme)
MKYWLAMRRGMNRREALTFVARAAGCGAAARLVPLTSGVAAQAPAGPPGRPPAAKGTTLILLGTQGGPGVNLARGEAANVVVVDGQPYVVDCGYGALRALVQAGIRAAEVNVVCLSHLHNDHTADVAALLSHQWTGSKAQPTTVFGPFGTAGLVEGAIAFFKADTEIRIVDEGRTVRPETLFKGRDVAASAKPVEVFKDERVTVTAIENEHYPERAKARMPYRSLAYRVDTATRSIVFSGDTAPSANLVTLARNADLFVCEAMDVARHAQMLEQAKRAQDAGNENSIARHVAETHSTTEDVGRMAAEAKVKTVVLSHLLPGSNGGELPDTAYIGAVRKFFDGEVIVGRDGMRL